MPRSYKSDEEWVKHRDGCFYCDDRSEPEDDRCENRKKKHFEEKCLHIPCIKPECRCDECCKCPPWWWFCKLDEEKCTKPERKREEKERNELAAYAYVFVRTTPSEVIAPNADIVFTNNGPLKNVTHVSETTAVVIRKSGAYEIFYAVSALTGTGIEIALAVNGVVDSSTPITVFETPENASGKVILNLLAGQILTLRNNGPIHLTLAAAPEIGAQLTLERLGDIEEGEFKEV